LELAILAGWVKSSIASFIVGAYLNQTIHVNKHPGVNETQTFIQVSYRPWQNIRPETIWEMDKPFTKISHILTLTIFFELEK
jgi:hypothetical protein